MILTVYVKPSARKNELEWIDENTLKIAVTEVAEKGKANKAVLKMLAKELKVAPTSLELIRGKTARIKQIKVL